MAKGCKHISSLSIPKLGDKLASAGLTYNTTGDATSTASETGEHWVCAFCLQVFSGAATAVPHGRKHNHTIFFCFLSSKETKFYCTVCVKDIDEDGLSQKHKGVVLDAGRMLVEALKDVKTVVRGKLDETDKTHVEDEGHSALRPSGLVNLGNTCFLNSALQALAAVLHTQPESPNTADVGPIGASLIGTLSTIPFSSIPTSEPAPTHKLLKRRTCRSGHVLDPSAFLAAIAKRYKEFRRMRQQDSHDFLRLLFNVLDDEHKDTIKSSNNKTAMKTYALHQTTFGGTLVSRVTCKACKGMTETEEAFLDLSLAIPPPGELDSLIRHMRSLSTEEIGGLISGKDKDLSLEDLLQFWARPAQLAGENDFACENCPREESFDLKYVYRPAVLQLNLRRLPPCLLFHLQRFSVTGVGKRGVRLAKDHTQITIPDILDLAPFLEPSDRPTTISTRYRLTALVMHEGGSVDSGHYVAAMRYGTTDSDWWYASDTSVRRIPGPAGFNPYLVFYTRIDA